MARARNAPVMLQYPKKYYSSSLILHTVGGEAHLCPVPGYGIGTVIVKYVVEFIF